MALAVEESIRAKKHLVVEAGTGVGKSFGYLVPRSLQRRRRNWDDSEKKIMKANTTDHYFSTHYQPPRTIARQRYSLLNSVIPRDLLQSWSRKKKLLKPSPVTDCVIEHRPCFAEPENSINWSSSSLERSNPRRLDPILITCLRLSSGMKWRAQWQLHR